MRTPRTITIVKLLVKTVSSVLNNESLLLQGSLAQLDRLGGIYIKFLQIVVLNYVDPAGQEDFRTLLAVYEHSRPDELDIRRYLRESGLRDLSRFAEIDAVPFATGSFGQVYRARLQSGQAVVIKVLRPGVIRYIKYDLRLINFLSFCYGVFDRKHVVDFRQIYHELRRTCLQEIDYNREAEAAELYYEQYKNHPHLAIPRTFREISNERVIVQEFIDGLSLADLLGRQSTGQDARQYVRATIGSDLFEQLYTIGYELLAKTIKGELLQADPHPGNILLLPNDRVALIDFGMTARLTHNRLAFYELLLEYRNYYTGTMAIENFALAALKFLSPKLYAAMGEADKILHPEWRAARSSLVERVRQMTAQVAREDSTASMINSMLQRNMLMKVLFFAVNRDNRFGFNFDMSSITLLKAAQTYLKLLAQFDREVIVFTRVLNDVVAMAEQNPDRIADTNSVQLKPAEALEILSNWFDKMARNDPWLMNQVTGGYI